jgi:hypothetical protein
MCVYTWGLSQSVLRIVMGILTCFLSVKWSCVYVTHAAREAEEVKMRRS